MMSESEDEAQFKLLPAHVVTDAVCMRNAAPPEAQVVHAPGLYLS